MNTRHDFKNKELEFWSAFGYSEDDLIYCDKCELSHECDAICTRNV